MNDPIDRQAAIDALRYAQHRFTVADEAGGIGTVKWSEDVIYFAAAERILTELPSAQPDLSGYSDRLWKAAYERGKAEAQPDIIHCGECKYYHNSDGCFFSTATTGADGFCHWAERKEGEADEQT